jgi:hypothetical protein
MPMKPSKPFLFCLALVGVCGATVLLNAPAAQAATTEQGMPLSAQLTPAMVDFFGLQAAYDRPSMQALAACHAQPECGDSDSSRVRFFDASGAAADRWDGAVGSVIERVRTVPGSADDRVREWRREVRRYTTDEQGRIVMQGSDSIVRVTVADSGREPTRITRVNRYTNVRYLVTDPRYVWPLTGLVVLELSNEIGKGALGPATPTAGHAAVSFDGTAQAHIITTGALTHTADLQGKRLETVIPDR